MHRKLIQHLQSFHHFNADEIALIKDCFEPVEYPKNTIIEEKGNVPEHLYYIVSGYLRLFHTDEKGNEITTRINCPPG
ncbi:MAG: cyclic nucleotide-binding domain-containing protein, partial [Chlorobi bacterium]|nr:cyclic nucleotide-binding domain-containing protein [Chlorobiota bacterium]